MISLEGQTAIVTGAAKGIGRAHSLEFARRGAAVVVNDVDSAAAEDVVREIVAAGGRAVASPDSVATREGGEAIVAAALDHFGSVEILVNNAGTLRPAYFGDMTQEQMDLVLDIHLRGAFFVTQPAWRRMREKNYGRIVMTSSSSGMFGHHATANYSAAKGGLFGLTKALAYEGMECGIKVNALLPMALTTIGKENPIPDMLTHYRRFVSEELAARFDADRRDPMRVSHLVTYLVSRECAVNGEAFSASGGRYAKLIVGLTKGWLPLTGEPVDADAVAAHLDEIRETQDYQTPMWLFEEVADVASRL